VLPRPATLDETTCKEREIFGQKMYKNEESGSRQSILSNKKDELISKKNLQ